MKEGDAVIRLKEELIRLLVSFDEEDWGVVSLVNYLRRLSQQ